MEKIFLNILNMTFTASFIIAVIIIVRLFLNKTPKIISYVLWIAAGFRLVFPFSVESVLSLMPVNTQPISQDILEQAVPHIDSGISVIDNAVSYILPVALQAGERESVNYLQIILTAGSIIWLVGIAAMLIYSSISTLTLKRGLRSAIQFEDNIYKANIKTPFVTGFFRPKIYIPMNLQDNERDYVILHERTHIKRHDNFIKLFAYLILSLHWFNPLVWAAFILMSMDMEMSCDESVLSETGKKTKKAYSQSILSLATERHTINIYPLAFGEGNTVRRIKNVLNYKKHSKIKIAISFILVAVLTVGFMLNNTISADNAQDNNNFQHAVKLLYGLHFLENENISEDNITREEMAFFAAGLYEGDCGALYREKIIEAQKVELGDGTIMEFPASSTHDWTKKNYGKSVQECIDKGIMIADWFTNPNETVTLKEAIQMLVTALRYDDVDDYIALASTKEVKLLGKYAVFPFMGVSVDKVLTKNDAVMLVYNCVMSEYAVAFEFPYFNGLRFAGDASAIEGIEGSEYLSFKAVINVFNMFIATPISSKVTVDGKEIAFDAYNIDGNNYFELRDLAYALNGTAKQFDVDDSVGVWTSQLKIGKPYVLAGEEMAEKGTNNITVSRVPCTLYKAGNDGVADMDSKVKLIAYFKNGYGRIYFKLRDIAEYLNVSVSHDSANNTIIIDTSNPYTP